MTSSYLIEKEILLYCSYCLFHIKEMYTTQTQEGIFCHKMLGRTMDNKSFSPFWNG